MSERAGGWNGGSEFLEIPEELRIALDVNRDDDDRVLFCEMALGVGVGSI